jgi:hypothetical protein
MHIKTLTAYMAFCKTNKLVPNFQQLNIFKAYCKNEGVKI